MAELIEDTADKLRALSGSVNPGLHESVEEPSEEIPPPGDSYWVLPGKLLAGPYPGAKAKKEAEAKLAAFLDLGVSCFVDLTEEGEGPPLHPYGELLRTIAAKRGDSVRYVRIPIPDVTVPLSWQMKAILATLHSAIAEGETVYLHCWGGVGRTGTVVGCLLVEGGAPPEVALDTLRELRQHTQRAHRVSPETEAQRILVESWRGAETLVADQAALDRMEIEPVLPLQTPQPRSADEITSELLAGQPVTLDGPTQGQCVQAVTTGDSAVRVEVLDPVFWESGSALSDNDQQAIEELGFAKTESMWVVIDEADDLQSAAKRAAQRMVKVLDHWATDGDADEVV